MPVGRAGRIAAGLAAAILLLLVLAQLVLPHIAASMISSQLDRYGRVQSVSVTAWPAFELLWGRADSVTVRANELKLSPAQAAKLLWEARGASKVQMTAAHLQLGPLRMRDARASKRGTHLNGQSQASEADVQAALPAGMSVRLLSSGDGSVQVRVSGALFGLAASVDAVAGASEGTLVAHPVGLLLEGLQLTLFADRHVRVLGVGAVAVGGAAAPRGYRLTIRADLR